MLAVPLIGETCVCFNFILFLVHYFICSFVGSHPVIILHRIFRSIQPGSYVYMMFWRSFDLGKLYMVLCGIYWRPYFDSHISCLNLWQIFPFLIYERVRHRWHLPVLHYNKIMVIYPYPFLLVITQLFSWIIFINYCIRILTGPPG